MQTTEQSEQYRRQTRGLQDVLPLYFRIFLTLEQRIRSGEWAEGVALPSEQDFAADFAVSRVTIRSTMSLLEEAGLVTRHRGRGTFVSKTAIQAKAADSTGGLLTNIRDFEKSTDVVLHEFAERSVPDDVIERARRPFGPKALCIRRTRQSRGRPFSYSTAWVVAPESYLLSADTLGNRTVIAALESKGFTFSRAEQRLTAIAANAELAGYLNIAEGAPLIFMRRSIFDAHDRLVEYLEICYDPDVYEYDMNLTRDAEKGSAPRWVLRG